MSLEFIYGLHAGDNDFFYCGRTNNLARRLGEHLKDGDENGTGKQKRIFEIQSSGGEIEMKMLDCGDPVKMQSMEDVWKINLEAKGHVLLNERAGDGNPYLGYSVGGGTVVPWDASLFDGLVWEKDHPKCKAGERTAWVKSCQFFRTGKKKLRFWSPVYSNWDVHGPDMEAKYIKACKMLTIGTPENDVLREWVSRNHK